MARARNIKPSFFTNDVLAEIDPLGRLLFIALWTMADREGRLEDRPKRIKAEALPYDDANADSLLDELQERGFILRYQAGGGRYIQVLAFTKHQNPHIKEAASSIPAPCEHGASTVQAPEEHGASPADSPFLIPDSPSRIPEREAAAPPTSAREEPAKRSPSGSRIPAEFPTDAELTWAMAERPDLDVRLVAACFRDHWTAKAGKDGRKLDWAATWRNWVRNERRGPPPRAAPAATRIEQTIASLTGRTRQASPEIIDVAPTAAARLG